MVMTNINRQKVNHPARLSYNEAKDRIKVDKANKRQRRVNRYDWISRSDV